MDKIYTATAAGDVETFTKLMETRVLPYGTLESIMNDAAARGFIGIVKAVQAKRPDIDVRIAFAAACFYGHVDLIELFLFQKQMGGQPLPWPITVRDIATAEYLLSRGFKVTCYWVIETNMELIHFVLSRHEKITYDDLACLYYCPAAKEYLVKSRDIFNRPVQNTRFNRLGQEEFFDVAGAIKALNKQ